MGDLGEGGGGRGADPARRAVAPDQLGEARLDRIVAPAQLVISGIADLRGVLGVIAPVMMRDLGGKTSQLALRLRLGQQLDRAGGDVRRDGARRVHGRAPAIRLAAAARASAVTVL